jgi:hypothetical protein
MMQEQFSYKKLSDLACQILNKGQVPLYMKKFSKKTFTTHQLLTLLFIKTYEKKGYRAFISFLKASHIPKWLKLSKIPHFTTLQKFADRLQVGQLEKLLLQSGSTKKFQRAGIDGTCMTFRNPSRHYEKRVGMKIKKRDFFKTAIMADLDHQLVLAVKLRKKSRHDTLDFIPLWNKIKHLKFKWFYMDRGYDKEKFHKMIFEAGKISFGCLKNLSVPVYRTKGETRKLVKRQYKKRKKNWRALIESINRAFKAVCSHVVQAKKLHTQKVEMFLKLITYNLYRRITRKINFALNWITDFISNFILCFKHKMVMTS